MTPKPTDGTPRPLVAPLLMGLVVLAVLVRGFFWLETRPLPLYQTPSGDAATYVQLAEELERDGLLAPRGEPYRRAPLYPLLLRALDAIGLGLGGARALQFLLGVAGVPLLWILGRRLAGRTGAVVAGLGGAVYGPFVFFEGDLLSISVAVFLLEAALVAWGSGGRAVLTGFLFGLAALAQPNFLLAGVIAAAVSILLPRRMGWPDRRAALLVALGLCVPPGATLVRNLAESGEPILISTNGGINFFIGNNPAADGTFHLPRDSGLLNRPEGLFSSARSVAEREAGRPLSHVAVDRHWWLRGVDFWITESGRALGVTLVKVLLVLNNAEVPSHYDYIYVRDHVPVLKVLPTMGWLLPLGGLGLILGWRRRGHPAAVVFLALVASVVPFFITGRYRLPLAVLLWPAAGLAVAEIWKRRRALTGLAPWGGAILAYAVLAFFPLYEGGPTRAHMLNVEGAARIQQGDWEGARESFEKALEVNPNHPEVLNNLAFVCEQQGDVRTALSFYRRALGADPTQPETYFNLESIYRRAGRNQEALEILDRLEAIYQGRLGEAAGKVAYRRGINRFSLGDTVNALTELETAVAADSSQYGAWVNLSTLYRRLSRFGEAVHAAERATTLAPTEPQPQASLGRNLEAMGRFEEAGMAYARALQLGPPDRELHYRAGRAFLRGGRGEEGEAHLIAANEGSPHNEALWELGQYYESAGRREDALTAYDALIRVGAPQALDAKTRLRALDALPRDRR